MDLKNKINAELAVVRDAEKLAGNTFKVRAYDKVIDQLRTLTIEIRSLDDIKAANVTGIGSSIEKKISDIITTGHVHMTADISDQVEAFSVLSKVHGIGPSKANELISQGITSIDDLRAHAGQLTKAQQAGLKHFDDLQKRIPRKEMVKHETLVHQMFKDKGFTVTIAGSFRRGAASSGDIDVLVTLPRESVDVATSRFRSAIAEMQTSSYISDVLALGDNKCMAVSKLPRSRTHRRLDVLLTTPSEYPYALLYFTGSQEFNIAFRAHALDKGYSVNEHGIKVIKKGVPSPPDMTSEEDIFRFIGISYVNPEMRTKNIFLTRI